MSARRLRRRFLHVSSTAVCGNLRPEGGIDDAEEASEAGCGSVDGNLESGVLGPISFLIKEQAKSLLAIKELQDRVKTLHEFRNDTVASQEIQQTIQSNLERPLQVFLTASKEPTKAASVHRTDSRAPLSGLESKSWTVNLKPRRHKDGPLMTAVSSRARAGSAAVGGGLSQGAAAKSLASLSSKGDTASAILESDEQDSGLDSDCREHGSRESTLAPKDELMELLEVIQEQSVQLQERMRKMEKSKNLDMMLRGGAASRSEELEFHEKELRARLSEMEVERSKHRLQVRQLQATIHRIEGERVACVKKLQTSLSERKELEKVHSLYMQYARAGPSYLHLANSYADLWSAASPQGTQQLLGDIAKGITTAEGKAKVSNILKESNVLELKRLLLVYKLENQALKEKADESDQHWFAKLSEWKAAEAALRVDIQTLLKEKQERLDHFRRHQRDMEIMQAKYKELEMTVWALDNVEHEKDFRQGEGLLPVATRFVQPTDQRHPRPCQNFSYGDTGCKAKRMPPMLLNQARNSPLMSPRGGYATELRLNSPVVDPLEEVVSSNKGMAYEPVKSRYHKSTVFAGQPQKTFSPYCQDHRAGAAVMPSVAVHLMNLEDGSEEELKSDPKSNIEIICNEFDPLSENGR
ncbi:hypothetical protein HPB50_016273 [Hyalomma asiaticum]|uniref:Uncharacterized protein n=1 Tax=Hyalomma asiaticum TaxID=266040 RepID=A0ACB7TJ36_HYAAI|nr:hypothetical protein HPB50_016273 [Hyalomma asiaticum]